MLNYLPFLATIIPIVGAVISFRAEMVLPKKENLITVLTTLPTFLVVVLMYPSIRAGDVIEVVFNTGFTLKIGFRADALSLLIGIIAITVWALASIYSMEFMGKEHAQKRYNCFSLLSLGGMMGVLFSSNLFTLYIFFELLSVASYVMVIHEETPDAMEAGIVYLFMGIAGGLILLMAIIATYTIAKTGDLSLIGIGLSRSPYLYLIFSGFLIGFGVKAGIFPLHIWLPRAYPVSPSPACALLSGVMAKAGAYGIIRTIYSIMGIDLLKGETMLLSLFFIAIITIFTGSAMAIRQKEIKKMLACSSIAQIGYILLGATLISPLGLTGGIVHIFNHSIIKSTLFLSAGAIIYQTGFRQLKDLKGIGKQMPLVTLCFTLASLSMIGFPPFNGFVSKWFLALGALESTKIGSYGLIIGILGLFTLLLSSFMNLIYFGPIVYNAWFGYNNPKDENKIYPNHPKNPTIIKGGQTGFEKEDKGDFQGSDPNLIMLIPLILLAVGTLVFGIFPKFPLELALQVSKIYFP